jgi:hypothetical protein
MMLKRSFGSSKDRVGKLTKPPAKRFFLRDHVKQKMADSFGSADDTDNADGRAAGSAGAGASPALASSIITIVVGRDQRLFAAHEDVLSLSPFLALACRDGFFAGAPGEGRRIYLPDEEPEVFSCVLEFLYKGDYSPRLVHDKRRNMWQLEGDAPTESSPKMGGRAGGLFKDGIGGGGGFFGGGGAKSTAATATLFHAGAGDVILRDTAVYCAADRYGLADLQRLALKKQGLQCGIEVSTILRSARFAYARTPDTDSSLRAHYLALIIRSRRTFKRSGTMQMEMEQGGKMFFDLFVAMCNHLDDLENLNKGTPRTV